VTSVLEDWMALRVRLAQRVLRVRKVSPDPRATKVSPGLRELQVCRVAKAPRATRAIPGSRARAACRVKPARSVPRENRVIKASRDLLVKASVFPALKAIQVLRVLLDQLVPREIPENPVPQVRRVPPDPKAIQAILARKESLEFKEIKVYEVSRENPGK
jgi:hypothetical protein